MELAIRRRQRALEEVILVRQILGDRVEISAVLESLRRMGESHSGGTGPSGQSQVS